MRLLIADDDDYTREGLRESIDWEQYGIDEVLLAGDGAEALRICTINKPEIVLTDIRMPKLNGIEFAERLSEKSPGSILIFMSGYMDVEYLRSAIKLSAVEYIEKPIKLVEVEQAILKSVRALQEKQAQTDVFRQKNELVKQKLAGLLRDEHADRDEITRLCRETGFPEDKRYLGFIARDRMESDTQKTDLDSFITFWHENGFKAIGEQLDRRHCFVIVVCDSSVNKKLFYLSEVFLTRNVHYVIGIGAEASGVNAIRNSYLTARSALERSFYSPDSRFLTHQEETGRSNEFYSESLPFFYKLCKESPEKLPDWLRTLFASFREKQYPARERVIALLETIAQTLINDNQKIIAMLENEHGITEAVQSLRKCATIERAESITLAVASVWLEEKQQVSKYSRLVQEVMNYVASNYRNIDLDLTMIAGHMNLSTNHLGKLFKEETGTSIKQYISDYRIDLAKKLVESEHYKMHTIAELCGFASASYFVKVFKASTDLSPLQYRKKS
ncbi:response regulator transcription factor [Paenibacillus prosopidis]|uniref:Two-component system response regulator YesN n=1 Tax=Paenibacillus prosopidis TaxID=630520 RepID=A0A368VW24_9BACL|nr:response regulator [Paenibacillus prosopidis]RCW45457.1 two-component system response regulator YesN [Paenibacillus prosopidis]